MEENKNYVIIQNFLGEIYHNEIYDYELYKALIRIVEAIKKSKKQSMHISYPNFVNELSKKMISMINNNKSISYKSIADMVIAQINGLRCYTDKMRDKMRDKMHDKMRDKMQILDIKLSDFKIPYFEFRPVDIFIKIETDDYTNEKFINKFILNNKYASTDLFKPISINSSEKLRKAYKSERLKTCFSFNISDKGFNYVVDRIKEVTASLDKYNKENKKDI